MIARPRSPRPGRPLVPILTALTLLVAARALPRAGGRAIGTPDIVFVSRQPLRGTPGIPGLGPRQRAAVTGGRLMVRRRGGHVSALVSPRRFYDVSDPSVSYDGAWIAFAAVTAPDSAWRIWIADARGRDLAPLTRTDHAVAMRTIGNDAALARYDDLDPCWLPDGRVCFASTRFPMQAESGGPVTNLFIVNRDGSHLIRITDERDGAEEPTVDPVTGRIVCARWWTSRFLASDVDPSGITMDPTRAMRAERISLWHAISIRPDGAGIRLAGGYPRVRAQTMAYQPLVLDDGTLVGVTADDRSLAAGGGRVRLIVYPHRFGVPRTFPGPPAQMCSPASLPDGRLVVACDTSGRGDFGLCIVDRDGGSRVPLYDHRGTLELDPVVLAPRPLPPVLDPGLMGLPRALPVRDREDLDASIATVRFDCLNVFANGPVDFPIPDAPALARDVRIRFFAALARPGSPAGDSLVLVREAPVERSGAIHEDQTPGDVPMFEQLVDAHGHVLQSTSGPAHVPGFNAGRMGAGTQCVGCHIGHSAIPVEVSYSMGKRFNAAPAAVVTASSTAPGSSPRALVDRRTLGSPADVAWIASGTRDESITLRWPFPMAIDSLVIHGIRSDAASGTDLRVQGCEVTLRRGTRVVSHLTLRGPIEADGSGVACGGREADAVEIRPGEASGRVLGVARTGLAEVEAKARIPED